MAAGDIILSSGATITAAEIEQIAAEVEKNLAAKSKELSQFEEVTSLANVSSLPGIQQSGATLKLVRVALEVLKGVDGKNIELTASQTAIQWRYVGESAWKTLVELSLLKGDKGDAGEKVMLRKGANGIEWKYANETDSAYKTLVSIDDIKLKFSDLTDDDKAELTKIPILGTVSAENGETPSGNFTTDGYDSNGNPKYVLHLTVTKGDKGEPPVLEIGTVTTGLPDTDATAEVKPNGETSDGKPKFLLNLTVPRGTPGQDGTGSGNVYVQETGLQTGKKYLFQPGASNSPNGTFVEYVEPVSSVNITDIINRLKGLSSSDNVSEEDLDKLIQSISNGSPMYFEYATGFFQVKGECYDNGTVYLYYDIINTDNYTIEERIEIVRNKVSIHRVTIPTIEYTAQGILSSYDSTSGNLPITKNDSITKAIRKLENAIKGINIDVSKETIEQALTGNITTHRHDTTYNYTDFETDVWDGTSISTSLQGSGTKDDPYLIQSCADWLHLRLNPGQYNIYGQSDLGNATEFKPYFKLNKNLDFGNKTIPEIDISDSIVLLLMCVFDGSGAKLSNFVDSQGVGILPPAMYYFAHDFVIDNLQTTIDVNNGIYPIFSAQDIFSTILNCTVNADVTLTGSTSNPGENVAMCVTAGEYAFLMGSNFVTEINSYVESNGCFSGVDISFTDNTTKSDNAYMIACIVNYCVAHPITMYCTCPLYEVSEETPQDVFAITMLHTGGTPAAIYTNSEGTNTISIQPIEGSSSTFTGTPKSLTEMKSASFVEELNSHLPKPAFRQDPDGGTPILAGGNATIAYDGYVKKSEFESFKKNINVEEPPAVIDSLSSESTTDALSANMGKKLNDEKVGSSEIRTIKKLTQSSYDGLSSKDSKTLYVIVG